MEKYSATKPIFTFKRLVLSIVISYIFVISSLFWAKDTANTHADLSQVDLGWPMTFVTQDFSWLDPPENWFPYRLGFGVPQEHPTSFRASAFFIDWIMAAIVLYLILFVAARPTNLKKQ
jgi:hypothetical protein